MNLQIFKLSLLDNRYPALHGLRALMILLTAQMHVTLHVALVIYLGSSEHLVNLFRYSLNSGWQTMDLFFVMSGFLIGRILYQSYSQKKKVAFRFYIRRAIRTIPLYIVSLVLLSIFFIYWPEASVNKITTVNWKVELFYLTNYMKDRGILAPWSWSLCVEEHFYLIGPLIIFLFLKIDSGKNRFLFLFSLAISALGFRYLKFLSTEDSSINIFKDLFIPTHVRYDTFVWGIGLAYLSFKYQDRISSLYSKKWIEYSAWFIVLAIGWFFLNPVINEIPFMYLSYGGTESDETIRKVAFKSIFNFGIISSIMFFILIQILISTNSLIVKFLSLPFFRYLATLSYGFYLVHLPIAKLVTHKLPLFAPNLDQSPMLFWLISFILTCATSYFVSYVLHLTIEKPLLFFREKFFP